MKFDNGGFSKLTNIVIVYWKYCLLKWIKRGYNHNFSRTINKVWFLILFFFPQAFQHLLQTDRGFVTKIHQAYVESLNTQLN